MKTTITAVLLILIGQGIPAQDSDSVRKHDLLPIITYSAESALNLGLIGFKYFDLDQDKEDIPVSFVNTSAIYTSRNQLFLESGYQIFLPNADRINGRLYYFDAPDRNYGLGNEPDLRIIETKDQEIPNYLNVDVTRLGFIGNYQKIINDEMFLGPSVHFENVLSYDTIPDSFQVIRQSEKLLRLQDQIKGKRVGIGLSFTFDTRDRVINPGRGHLFQLLFLANSKIFGSDYEYTASRIEFTKYVNPFRNHTLAFRIIQDWKHPLGDDGKVPLYGLSRPNSRGYIRGTFQDYHAQQIDIEYRMPFWREDKLDYPKFHFWKGLGMVFFISGQQAYGESDSYRLSNTNFALGSGLRILLNKKNRLNLRIDYAYGLLEGSDGINGRQVTFSFNLSEAF